MVFKPCAEFEQHPIFLKNITASKKSNNDKSGESDIDNHYIEEDNIK